METVGKVNLNVDGTMVLVAVAALGLVYLYSQKEKVAAAGTLLTSFDIGGQDEALEALGMETRYNETYRWLAENNPEWNEEELTKSADFASAPLWEQWAKFGKRIVTWDWST